MDGHRRPARRPQQRHRTKLAAAGIWQASAATSVKALYGRAYRAPNVFEREYGDGVSQVPNASLKGESIDTLEAVIDHRIGRDVTLRASVYRWTMDDLVALGIDPVSGLSQYQSGGAVSARGVELSADKTWVSGARLRGSLSLQDVKQSSGAALPNSPDMLAKINLSGPLPWAGLRAGYEWRYDTKRLSLDGTQLSGYAISNLVLGTQALAKVGTVLTLSTVDSATPPRRPNELAERARAGRPLGHVGRNVPLLISMIPSTLSPGARRPSRSPRPAVRPSPSSARTVSPAALADGHRGGLCAWVASLRSRGLPEYRSAPFSTTRALHRWPSDIGSPEPLHLWRRSIRRRVDA